MIACFEPNRQLSFMREVVYQAIISLLLESVVCSCRLLLRSSSFFSILEYSCYLVGCTLLYLRPNHNDCNNSKRVSITNWNNHQQESDSEQSLFSYTIHFPWTGPPKSKQWQCRARSERCWLQVREYDIYELKSTWQAICLKKYLRYIVHGSTWIHHRWETCVSQHVQWLDTNRSGRLNLLISWKC